VVDDETLWNRPDEVLVGQAVRFRPDRLSILEKRTEATIEIAHLSGLALAGPLPAPIPYEDVVDEPFEVRCLHQPYSSLLDPCPKT
jgi:hypothetical protein